MISKPGDTPNINQNIKFDKFGDKKDTSSFDYLDIAFPETSNLANNTNNKISTIAEEFAHLDLANQSNPTAINANVNYLKDKALPELDTSKINELVTKEVLETKQMKIIAYSKEEIQKNFNFKNNGFEFGSCSEGLLKEVKSLKKHIAEKGQNAEITMNFAPMLEASEKELELWAAKQGLVKGVDYDVIVPLGGVYRDESKANTFPIAHVDFPKEDTSKFMDSLSYLWKDAVEKKLNKKLTNEEYANVKIAMMVNIWMPLNEKPTKNTLAVMDTSRIKDSDLTPVTTHIGPFPVKTNLVSSSQKHQFFIQGDMKEGDEVIFNTLNTPHTAVNAPRPEASELPRQSAEIRAIFIKNT